MSIDPLGDPLNDPERRWKVTRIEEDDTPIAPCDHPWHQEGYMGEDVDELDHIHDMKERRRIDDVTDKDWVVYDPSMDTPPNDSVNHPAHYTNRKMEAIDIIEMIIETEKSPKVAYNMSNVLKYLLRFRAKGNEVTDLKKAMWYLTRMTQHVEDEKK